MEYTDAPQPEISAVDATTMPCPYCGHTLPKDATECDRCDWVRQGKPDSAEGKASDAFAVLLSIVPGLGHMYKGHTVLGLMILLIGTPMALGLAALIATGTAGFGLGLLPLYFIAVMFHVYGIEDRITPKDDEGEQY